jgi:2-desacetyl-2-hydroxyethyl bacteriochlorophyllide A dehydrogenase
MKALVLEHPRQFRFVERPEPARPVAGEALVRPLRVGICGTDYGGFLGTMPYYSYPRVPGHELGVEVLAVGEGVTNVRPGDLCAVEPYINCTTCFPCRTGAPNCCENHRTLGVMMDGGLTERLVLPARKLHPANGLSPDQCALVETLAVGCHAINRGAPVPGENVLVIGAGPIGLSVIEFARLSGARTIVMDMNERRLEFVRDRMGIAATIGYRGDGTEVDALEGMTEGTRAQVVIDATGSSTSMSNALSYCSFTGRLVYVGMTHAEVSFPHAPVMHRRELTLLASRNALPSDFTRIVTLIETGAIDTRPWITHRPSFRDLIQAFPDFTRPGSDVIKAIVNMEQVS